MPGSAVSDLAGRVLAGRYLLHGAIGTGASGRVYVADDTRLRRRVAVKVLHAALADDAAFLRRFRAEAQLAASLHHPHIVTVHDWGEDDVPFMVLELLEGGSLRSILDRGDRLTVPQAARVGRDVASALEYAHSRGVLHRDIKPANLLFDEHGIVRVADFGLARALAEASWTEPVGAMFGTARYASPEQARGVQLDARSDLYSLALVLVEAVTGEVPFGADTTLGTLAARTQAPLVAPDTLGPLAPVVDRAGALEADARYPDAATMRAALADAADRMPPPGPVPLAGMTDGTDPHPTRAVPEAAPVAAAATRAPLFDQDAVEVVHDDAPVLATVVHEPGVDAAESRRARRRRIGQRRLVPFVVGLVLLATIGFATAALAQIRGGTPITLRDYSGLTQAQAVAAARADGLSVSFGAARASADSPGIVVDQAPVAGSFTTSRHVALVLSSGPAKVAVPNIVRQPWASAQQVLADAGFLARETEQSDEQYAKGLVLSVNPGVGSLVLPDTFVDVVVSSGHAPVDIPDVSGLAFADASDQLSALHFVVQRADEFSDTVTRGDVTRTDPPFPGQAAYGSTVKVYVSKGPDLVQVPLLLGLTFDQASNVLSQEGLYITQQGRSRAGDVVIAQDKAPFGQVVRGDTITVRLGRRGG